MLARISSREDPGQTVSLDLGLLVSLGLFSRQLVFEILEHIQYKKAQCVKKVGGGSRISYV